MKIIIEANTSDYGDSNLVAEAILNHVAHKLGKMFVGSVIGEQGFVTYENVVASFKIQNS